MPRSPQRHARARHRSGCGRLPARPGAERRGRAAGLRAGAAAALRGYLRGRRRRLGELGMATAEYAVVTVAACGFAGLLVALLRSGEVRSLLFGIIKRALVG